MLMAFLDFYFVLVHYIEEQFSIVSLSSLESIGFYYFTILISKVFLHYCTHNVEFYTPIYTV